ncbi:hypothetical protein AQUCO_03700139v1 [Aquilegia coerulea]|uniref:pyruvate kinase n=2 Tax=Aquilegia coerulea TaxID=218851 RepID=A0A2G5CTQ1_AQUCA|nr:hypothetical protein AQUCO_03700139v1 [Aquilegia coerulea]
MQFRFFLSISKVESITTKSVHNFLQFFAIFYVFFRQIAKQMTLHAPSAHFVAEQCSIYNHVSQIANPSVLNNFKSGKISRPTCRFYIRSSVFGYGLIQLQTKPNANLRKKCFIFASLKENDEERGSSGPYIEEEMPQSIFKVSETNQNSNDSDVETAASVPISEDNLIKDATDNMLSQGNLLDKLKAVHLHVLALEQWNASRLKLCHRGYYASATNLIHYLALKCLDVGQLKEELSSNGLLNLDSVNNYVLASITAAVNMLENQSYSINSKANGTSTIFNFDVLNKSTWDHSNQRDNVDFSINTLKKRVFSHSEALLGPLRDERTTHVMVTVGREATENDTLLSDLLRAGATLFRINCAYGDPSVWSEIIRRAKKSSQMLEKPCRILMDLAGPKLRTGSMEVGPSVLKISPKKNASGYVIFPAQVWLSQPGSGPPPAHLSMDANLVIDNEELLHRLEVGNVLSFYDTRGKRRLLKITKKVPVFGGIGCVAECSRTAYVESGTTMCMKGKKRRFATGNVVEVPCTEQFVRLKTGDLLTISRDPCLTPEHRSGESATNAPRITCSSSHLFDSVKPGEPIAFDDGRIWGVIQGTSISEIIVSITCASPKGSKLGSGKSINIPESEIKFEGLTSKDLMDLEFVASHADMVGISFVRDVRDIVVLQNELEKRKLQNLGVVLKIETRSGFEKLPLLLLQAMRSRNPLGIMIARGDLAVECGWERLADIQEEIMSICGAAHVPVIWATQVLESLVKSGLPTRAEISDVASGKRASCIMLNKGKFITEAVSTLDSMLRVNTEKVKAELKPLVLSSHTS